MKKLKLLLFILPFIFISNVFADTSYDMTSRITSPVNFNECGVGSYTGVELNGATNCWSTNVRYQGTLNRIYFNLPSPTGNAFESDTAYRLTLNMATNDWRNNFGSPVVGPGSNYSNNFVDSFSFVSKKQINITFTVPYGGSTTYQTLYVNIPAKNSSSLITGDTNWNLSKVTLTKLTSGSGGGSTSPTGPSTSFDDTSIINSGKENTQDIINNNNTNTQDIINNNNNNTNELQDTITENLNHCRDSYNLLDPDSLSIGNISTETGQNSNGEFVINTGFISIDNDYDVFSFRYNTYSSSPQIVVYYYNNTKNYIGFDVINSNTGSLLISSNIKFIRIRFNGDFSNSFNFQVEKGSTVHSYEKYGERICSSRLEDIYGAIGAGSQSVIINNNENTQDIINNQNQNAQETQNTINESFGNSCRPSTNLFLHDDISYTRNSGNINIDYSKGIFNINGTTTSGAFVIGTNTSSSNSSFKFGHFKPGRYYLIMRKTSGTLTTSTSSSSNSGLYVRISSNDLLFQTSVNRNTDFYGHVFDVSEETDLYLSFYVPASNWIFNDYSLQFQLVNGDQLLPYEEPGVNICNNKLDAISGGINDVNDSINNSNVDSGTGTDFFDDFTSQDFGLSQIITIPLNTIQGLTSKSCSPLQVPIPFTNSNVNLPCMTQIYETKFPSIYNLWKIVSFGIVAYLIAIDIFHIVKGFKDPESDKVEVLDL